MSGSQIDISIAIDCVSKLWRNVTLVSASSVFLLNLNL